MPSEAALETADERKGWVKPHQVKERKGRPGSGLINLIFLFLIWYTPAHDIVEYMESSYPGYYCVLPLTR
jgi:hypothetical protein